jgi:hypothetical protein
MKKYLLVVVMMIMCILVEAQVQTPAPSPAGSVSTVVGLTDIKINYSRPRAKGRKIFGTDPKVVVPYGVIWRTGANSGTKISFSDDVKVEGVAVPKGEYLIFTWPGAAEWTVSLYKDLTLGGNVNAYAKENEIATFKVKPEKLTEKVETLTFNISDIADDNKSAKVQLAWENTSIKFTVSTDYDAKVMKSIEASTKVDSYNYFQAAVYYLETKRDLNQALTWINEALKSNPTAFWMLYQKARIQKELGDKKGAAETATASLNAAKEAKNRDYQMMNEDLLKVVQ